MRPAVGNMTKGIGAPELMQHNSPCLALHKLGSKHMRNPPTLHIVEIVVSDVGTQVDSDHHLSINMTASGAGASSSNSQNPPNQRNSSYTSSPGSSYSQSAIQSVRYNRQTPNYPQNSCRSLLACSFVDTTICRNNDIKIETALWQQWQLTKRRRPRH